MIEEVAIRGYESTTVEHLIKRAGVSRKTFYARLASREELLLLAFDTASAATLKPVQQASRRTGGSTRQLEATMRRLCRSAREEPGAIELCTIDVAAAGPAGIARRETLMDAYGRLFQRCLEPDTEEPVLPPALPPILSGAVHRVIDSRLRAGREQELGDVALELARWVRSYHPTPAPLVKQATLAQIGAWLDGNGHLGGRAPGTLTLAPLDYVPPTSRRLRGLQAHTNRERILDAVARIAVEEGYASLNATSIAGEADVPERAFLAQFADKDDAFITAFELGHVKAQAIVARAREHAATWRAGVGAGIAGLLDFLASEPLYTHMAFISAPLAGPQMAQRTHEHAAAYAQLLFGGAPQRRRPPSLTPEAVVQAIFELAFTFAANGQATQLPAMVEQVVYLALAPYLGTGEAAKVVV
jgi:AcrR family transcriptional regulator